MFSWRLDLLACILRAGMAAPAAEALQATELEAGMHSQEYLALLRQLTAAPDVPDDKFAMMLEERRSSRAFTFVFFVQEGASKVLVGTGSFMAERKLFRGGVSKVHIEDIVVDSRYRKRGYGSRIIDFLKNEAMKRFPDVYKFTLTCSEKKRGFYEALGFTDEGGAMQLYVGSPADQDRGTAGHAESNGTAGPNPGAITY